MGLLELVLEEKAIEVAEVVVERASLGWIEHLHIVYKQFTSAYFHLFDAVSPFIIILL